MKKFFEIGYSRSQAMFAHMESELGEFIQVEGWGG